MSRNRHNLFTTSDAAIVAEIMAKVETYGRVTVLADRDADLHVGPDKWDGIGQRLAAHLSKRPSVVQSNRRNGVRR